MLKTYTLSKFYIDFKMINLKNVSCIETTINNFLNNLLKNRSKIHAYENFILEQKDMQSLCKVMLLFH